MSTATALVIVLCAFASTLFLFDLSVAAAEARCHTRSEIGAIVGPAGEHLAIIADRKSASGKMGGALVYFNAQTGTAHVIHTDAPITGEEAVKCAQVEFEVTGSALVDPVTQQRVRSDGTLSSGSSGADDCKSELLFECVVDQSFAAKYRALGKTVLFTGTVDPAGGKRTQFAIVADGLGSNRLGAELFLSSQPGESVEIAPLLGVKTYAELTGRSCEDC
ncbi:hypothetical protein [Rhizobium sp. BK376]|uniref:hypothetical protein n=1 Tax=Rhizobium sp. BK376 TaxID=2512149 RepID=UPI001048C6E7|nr:hypothetical protein [Rhizobium sp. BK376]TCR76795.1 hypothetical protein EV561_11955 [Rhizobium sp. BK376]